MLKYGDHTAMSEPRTDRVQTVTGMIEAGQLGPTLMHEHVLSDLTSLFESPTTATMREVAHEPIGLANLAWIRRNYFHHYDNLVLGDVETAAEELYLFREWGGLTVVDVTTPGIGRDPIGLARVSRRSGVNIVMATGFYVAATHPFHIEGLSSDDLAELMIREIDTGVSLLTPSHDDWMERREDTGLKAGIIKVGCSWPLDPAERRVLHAAAEAQRRCGVPITIHTGRDERSPHEIADELEEAGADMSRTILGHLDLRVQDQAILWDLAERGCFLQFDLFGTESSFFASTQFDMPSDAQRLDRIIALIERGAAPRVLISHDIVMKYRLRRYGGHGYSHILENVVPFMRKKGFTETVINQILVDNPSEVLTIHSSS